MVHQSPRVGREAAHGAPKVTVNLEDLFNGRRLHQGRRDALLGGQDDAPRDLDADRRRAQLARHRVSRACARTAPHLDRLGGVLDLEEPALGRERVDAAVVLGAREKHGGGAMCAGAAAQAALWVAGASTHEP